MLGLQVETDPDLHELRAVRRVLRLACREFGDTASLNWMPTAPRDHAEPGAESFDAMLARVVRVRERMEARAGDERILLVTHYGLLHFFLGHTLFGDAFGPEHLLGALVRRSREHGHQRVRAPPAAHGRDGLLRVGPDDLERSGPPVS